MPSTPSPSLRIELQETGESLNQWGAKLNQGLLMAEQALTGVLTKALTGNVTLGVANFVSDEARNSVLIFTAGSGLVAAPTVTLPPAPKSWHVDNRCGYPITFTMGGTPVTVPVGRQADVFCDGVNLFMLEPIAAASAVTQAFADQAATSAQTAMTSASTATTRRDQALAARDETYTARDTTLAYRNTTLGYRDAAATSATNSANSATASATSAAQASAAAGSVAAPSATRVYDNQLHYGS